MIDILFVDGNKNWIVRLDFKKFHCIIRKQPLSRSATPGQRILMGYEFFWIETKGFCANLTICVKLTPNVFVSIEKFVLIWLIIILTQIGTNRCCFKVMNLFHTSG